jgi:hypothetical protein
MIYTQNSVINCYIRIMQVIVEVLLTSQINIIHHKMHNYIVYLWITKEAS